MTQPQFIGYANKAPDQPGDKPEVVAVLQVSGQKFMMDAGALQQKIDESNTVNLATNADVAKERSAYSEMLESIDSAAKQNLQTIKSPDEFKGQPDPADPSLRSEPLFLGYANLPPDKDGNKQLPVAVVNVNGQRLTMNEEDLYKKCDDIESKLGTVKNSSGFDGVIDTKKELRDYATILGGLQDVEAKGDAGTKGLQTIGNAADFKVAPNAIPENTDRNAPGVGQVSIAVMNTLGR